MDNFNFFPENRQRDDEGPGENSREWTTAS